VGGLILAAVASVVVGPGALSVSAGSFSLIAAYSFIFYVMACILYFFAFNSVRPWLIASILSLEVVFGVALAIVWLHETVTALQIAGCLIVIAATIAIGNLSKKEEATGEASVATQALREPVSTR
jgi:drug/metabolite transporter (DMT)-like permease